MLKNKPIEAESANTYSPIEMVGKLEIIAAADESKTPTFRMNAYNGGLMRLQHWDLPVVVELAGMEIPSLFLPVRLQHDPNKGVGHTTKVVKGTSSLDAEGVVSRDTEYAREVVRSGKKGFPWQVSIGAEPLEVIVVADGERVKANGQQFDGPCYLVAKSRLNEFSLVDLGADTTTSAAIAAQNNSNKKELQMTIKQLRVLAQKYDGRLTKDQLDSLILAAAEADEDEQAFDARVKKAIEAAAAKPDHKPDTKSAPQAAVPPVQAQANASLEDFRAQQAAETERIAMVRKICAGKHNDIEAKAIREGWGEDKVKLEVLQAERPSAPNLIISGQPVQSMAMLEAAALMAGGISGEDVIKSHTEKVVEAANRRFRRPIGLQQLIMEAARANGFSGIYFRDDMTGAVRAAFSTMDLSGIMSNIANKFLLMGFNSEESVWREIARIRSVSDFKTITSYRMTGAFEFDEIGPTGELKHGEVGEESFTNKAKTHGKMFSITREDIYNDDLGALTDLPVRIGRGGHKKLNKVFWTEFMNNAAFFTQARGNYSEGANTALSVDGLAKAELLFLDQTDADGAPLGLEPRILLVPNALSFTSRQLMASTKLGRDDQGPTENIYAGRFRPMASRYLGNSAYAGHSSKAWYLLGSKDDLATMEVCFLNGQETPIVESADADFNVLGIQFRGYFDFGCAKQEWRAGVKMLGEEGDD
ncbi:MAG: hypothetical protein PHH26_08145 [Candidatus Thermoplasmatota archaeon]|nr:hypothetical protein [Candidatus Thermoplasmatota archaeon]